LLLLLPMLLVTELAIMILALVQGWWRGKLAGWAWIARNAAWVASRRRMVQRARTVRDRELATLLADRFEASDIRVPAAALVNGVLAAYWRIVRTFPL
jgi:hypothetical protein